MTDTFIVGQSAICIEDHPNAIVGDVFFVTEIDVKNNTLQLADVHNNLCYSPPHKFLPLRIRPHFDARIAHAMGADVEYRDPSDSQPKWKTSSIPQFYNDCDYRVALPKKTNSKDEKIKALRVSVSLIEQRLAELENEA